MLTFIRNKMPVPYFILFQLNTEPFEHNKAIKQVNCFAVTKLNRPLRVDRRIAVEFEYYLPYRDLTKKTLEKAKDCCILKSF